MKNNPRQKKILADFGILLKKLKREPTLFELRQRGVSEYQIGYEFGSYSRLKELAKKKYSKEYKSLTSKIEQHKASRREDILKKFAGLVKESKSIPSWNDLEALGLNRDKVKSYFNRHQDLVEACRQSFPAAFDELIDKTIFNKIHTQNLEESIAGYRRFVVTTAVAGCPVDENFLASIHMYCKTNDAMLLVLSSADPASKNAWSLDHRLGKEHCVVKDVRLNQNLFVSTIKLSAKHIDPTTGLGRIGQRNGTFIYASPKQRLRCVAMANNRFPHAIMTTGAVTIPQYDTDRYMSERTAAIATHDHVMGALIVEIEDDTRFHFRQVQADQRGNFIDLGFKYSANGISKESAAAVVMGDWHSGETDPTARDAWQKLCQVVRPDELFVHDGFNGKSINHHEQNKIITQSKKADLGELSLEAEAAKFAEDLDELSTWPNKHVVVVESNHDQFLIRYLEDGRYIKDPHNHRFSVKLVNGVFEGKLPLKLAVELTGLKNKSRVKWIEADEGYRVAGIELGAHGHAGANGGRNPGMAGIEASYGESVTGHSHTPEILRGAWRVGTSSFLRLDYNEGPSSWMHTSCVVYKNGARQLVNSFDGAWTTLDFESLNSKIKG